MRARMRGVTLTELMVVVVIIGILTMIAYPNYRGYAARAKRNEARTALLQIATNQERFYLQNNTYTTDMTKLGFALSAANKTGSGSYQVDVPTADADNFTAEALYLNSDDEELKCKKFKINGRNAQTSEPYTDCWTRTR